jgi:hypothetical protein
MSKESNAVMPQKIFPKIADYYANKKERGAQQVRRGAWSEVVILQN